MAIRSLQVVPELEWDLQAQGSGANESRQVSPSPFTWEIIPDKREDSCALYARKPPGEGHSTRIESGKTPREHGW